MRHFFPYTPTRVIFTQGHDYNLGAQHYEQIGQDCAQGISAFISDYIASISKTSANDNWKQTLHRKSLSYILQTLTKKLVNRLPQSFNDRLQGLSEAGQIPLDILTTAVVAPDLLPIITAGLYRLTPRRFAKPSIPPIFGCSSFIYRGKTTLIGRNLDFLGLGYWDRFQILQKMHRPNSLRAIAFTSAGCPIAGISGVNEAQIYVALHQHYGHSVQTQGSLPYTIGERILFTARTLADAKKILIEETTNSSWAFIVADGKSGEGFVCEKTPQSTSFRQPLQETYLCHTNKFLTPEAQKYEFAISETMNWNNEARRQRLEALLQKKEPTIVEAVAIISDHFDPYLQEQAIAGRTIGAAHNVQSYVLNLSEMKLYLAEGPAPVQMRGYNLFDLGEIFQNKEGRKNETYSSPLGQDLTFSTARETYGVSYFKATNGEFAEARKHLQTVYQTKPNSDLALNLAMLHVRLGSYQEGLSILSRARRDLELQCHKKLQCPLPPEYFTMILWQARICDLLERKNEAHEFYTLLHGNAQVKDTFTRHAAHPKRPYSVHQAQRVMPPYSLFIPQS